MYVIMYHAYSAYMQIVTCYTSDRFCETAMLGRVLFDAPGILGRYSDYAVTGTFKLVRVKFTFDSARPCAMCWVGMGWSGIGCDVMCWDGDVI